jgi:NAD-dependent deacetylase
MTAPGENLPPDYSLEEALENAANIIVAAKHTVALVGAGISVESGIPPFRGPGGLWTKYGEPAMDGYQKFMADPRAWWAERLERRSEESELMKGLEQARPNPAHHALADLEDIGQLQHIITQNIDNLHQEAGSVAITEIHGNRTKLRCMSCNARYPLSELTTDEIPPRCPKCQGIIKSDTVMFGEPIPPDALDSCRTQAGLADCMLLVGTSAVVYPAAEFPVIAHRRGARLVEINPMETPLSDACAALLRAPAGEVMPRLVQRIRELAARAGEAPAKD